MPGPVGRPRPLQTSSRARKTFGNGPPWRASHLGRRCANADDRPTRRRGQRVGTYRHQVGPSEGGTMKRVHKGLLVALVGGIAMLLAAGSAWAQSATPATSTGAST